MRNLGKTDEKIDSPIKEQDIFLKLSKLFFALFLLYSGWFQFVFFQISNMSLLLGAGMMLFIIFHSLLHKNPVSNLVTAEIAVWILFAFTSLLTGFFVAVNADLLLEAIKTFMQYLIMISGVVYISSKDKKIDYFINVYFLFSLTCAISTLTSGVYYSSIRISMSETTNPNLLGLTMVIGIFCILYKINFKSTVPTIFYFCGLFLLFYIIILTGSRKSFLGAAGLIALWLIFVSRDVIKSASRHIIRNLLIFMLIILAGGYLFFLSISNSSMLLRLEDFMNTGNETRISMYAVAVEIFMRSPLFGVGLDNYRAVAGFSTYSHSTYAEIIACTGIIGTTLYFIPYLNQAKKILRLIRIKDIYISVHAKLLGILFVILIFLGTGVIHFYDTNSYIAFSFTIAFYNIYGLKLKDQKAEGEKYEQIAISEKSIKTNQGFR